ncbi:hypothetical protein Tco_0238091 [Tanacetum coccineum]
MKTMDEEEDDKVTKELYKDVNINLGNKDVDMTDADQSGADQQNASQQSGFEQKRKDLIDTYTFHHEITSATTVPPPPPFFNPLQQETTPTPTPTTSEATTSFTTLPDFAFVFKFNERVTNLEKDLSEIKQVGQYAQALSSIPAIVDRYMDNKLGEAINKAIQAHNFNCREEAQAEKREYIELVDSTVSSSQPQSSYEAAATLSEFELTKILIDKMEKNKSFDVADYKRELYDALVKSYNTDKDIFESYGKVFLLKMSRDERDKDRDPSAGSDRGTKRRKSSKDVESSRDSKSKEKKSSSTSKDASQSQHNSFGKSAHAEEPSHTVEDSSMQVARAEEPPTSFNELNDTSFDFSAFVMNRLKIPNLTQEILVRPAFNLLKGTCKSIMELKYHLEECYKATTERIDWHNPKKLYLFDLRKPLSKYSTSVTKTKAATYELKWIEDLVPELWNQYKRKRLMRTDELHKFSDGTLNDVRSALHDIAAGIKMEYLPMRKCSNLDKKRARVMVVKFRYSFPLSSQNWRDLLRDIPLDSVVVLRYEKRSKSENKGIVLTGMELVLEQTQQGTSHEVLYEHVGPEVTRSRESKRSQDDDKRLCLVDDLKDFKITFMSSQRYKPKPKVKDHYINSQVKD